MSSDTQDQRFAPPQARVDDVETTGEGIQLATRGSRLAAAIVDVIVAFALMWVLSMVTPWNPFSTQGFGWWEPQFINALLGFVLFASINGWLLATRGQTIGKSLLKIRIARPDGAPASLGRLLGRYGIASVVNILPAAGQIWGFIDALAIFRQSHRCLHDSIADTIVLKA
jgi:uncharacterized RDD family membrane protein YckC